MKHIILQLFLSCSEHIASFANFAFMSSKEELLRGVEIFSISTLVTLFRKIYIYRRVNFCRKILIKKKKKRIKKSASCFDYFRI